jgi:hypothetical protein
MNASITDYSNWITTLTGADLATALAAGLDQPLADDSKTDYCRTGMQIRDFDGLPLFQKNGLPHPLQHEGVRDHSTEDYDDIQHDEIMPELAAALRRVVEFLVGELSAVQIFSRSRTVAQRVFVLARALQLNDCERASLADIAKAANLSRASLSKTSVMFRDLMGSRHLSFGCRDGARGIMKAATTEAWVRRKAAKTE